MSKLRYVPGEGFPGTIQDADGNMIAAINTWSSEEEGRYGRLFAAAPDLLDTIEATIEALEGSEFTNVVAWLRNVVAQVKGGNHGRGTDAGQSAAD